MAKTAVQEKLNDYSAFDDFIGIQVAPLAVDTVRENTFSLIALSAFLAGAMNALTIETGQVEHNLHAQIAQILETRFKMTKLNAEGLVNSTQRLVDKYILLNTIYQKGQYAFLRWIKVNTGHGEELKTIIEQNQHLSMIDLANEEITEDYKNLQADAIVFESQAVARSQIWKWMAWGVMALNISLAAIIVYLQFGEQMWPK